MDLDQILTYLDGTASTISKLGIPDVSAGAAVADGLLRVLQATLAKHNEITGEVLDLSKLEWIDPNI